jgi:hypothetical protein
MRVLPIGFGASTIVQAIRDRLSGGQLLQNGLLAAIQSVIVTGCLLLVYRLVIAHASLEQLGVWSLLLAVSGAPLVSLVVLEKLSPEVLIMSTMLTLGWAINVLAVPFYFAAQGQCFLRWNFASHVVLATSVLVGVFFPISLSDGDGLLTSIVFGLVLSAPLVIVGNSHLLGVGEACRTVRTWLGSAVGLITFICAISRGLYFSFSRYE